jgi:hypothetical protein
VPRHPTDRTCEVLDFYSCAGKSFEVTPRRALTVTTALRLSCGALMGWIHPGVRG